MVNLRYHIVSITAVFLALAVGILMGTTFVSRATVDSLKHNINGAETKIHNTDHTNSVLKGELRSWTKADTDMVTNQLPNLLAGKLANAPVLVVASPEVDQRYVQEVANALQMAGAAFDGTLVIDKRVLGIDPTSSDGQTLANILGVASKGKPRTDPTALLNELAAKLGAALGATATGTSTAAPPSTSTILPTPTTAASPTQASLQAEPKLVTQLRSTGFLDFQPAQGGSGNDPVLTRSGYRIIVLGATTSPAPTANGPTLNQTLVHPLLNAMVATGPVALVAASAADPSVGNDVDDNTENVREYFIGGVRSDKSLAGRLSTVDDIERSYGQYALVLAVEDAAQGTYGNYGVGAGASAVAPSHP